MSSHSYPDNKVLHAALLARMAVSRADLLAAHDAVKLAEAGRRPSFAPANLPALVRTAPNVTLLAALLLGSLILGPRRIARLVVRNGLSAWIARTVRRMAGR
ncbi:MAG TPA: hypothetical protein VNE00_18985 [Paraburkholderia sp.]|jgi:hypothetical protein|nr:hypothetical protein [Paraburkholderia sp.]